MKINSFKKKKEMELLPNKQLELHENVICCYICREQFKNIYIKDKRYCKFRDNFYYGGECRVLHIVYLIHSVMYLKKFL